jgi:hypothetical protein
MLELARERVDDAYPVRSGAVEGVKRAFHEQALHLAPLAPIEPEMAVDIADVLASVAPNVALQTLVHDHGASRRRLGCAHAVHLRAAPGSCQRQYENKGKAVYGFHDGIAGLRPLARAWITDTGTAATSRIKATSRS